MEKIGIKITLPDGENMSIDPETMAKMLNFIEHNTENTAIDKLEKLKYRQDMKKKHAKTRFL